ncbi:MAG: hypothetical protein HUU34_04965 [Saprospiraceae bacterium]|jgi:YD repeat-containing protein|nr:hypothetical protein [Saprospiraceae bacterium]
MKKSLQQMPPLDLSNLDEHFIIRFEYDDSGNLKSIRKEQRNRLSLIEILVLVAIVFVGIYFAW